MEIHRFKNDPSVVFSEDFSSLPYLRQRYTVNGNPQPVRTPYGIGLSFDGSSEIIVPHSSIFNITNEISISVWFYMTADPTTGTDYYLYGKGNNDQWKVRVDNGYIKGFLSIDGTNEGFQTPVDSITETNKWYHFVFTFDGTTIRMYLDGSFTNDDTGSSGNIDVTTDDLYIGSWNGSGRFDGYIKNVMIFDRALSTDEISDLHLGKVF